jgi:trimethylamine--corrinoid protein Co-methyltransferase
LKKTTRFNAPPLAYLNTDDLEKMHEGSIRILENTGCRIANPSAQALLKKRGATVRSNDRTYISKAMVEEALEKAPSEIIIYNRDQEPALLLEGTNVYFGTGSDCPYLLDLETGDPKPFTYNDILDAVRVADNLPHIDFLMSMGQAAELENRTAFQKKYWAMLKHSKKPQVLTSGPKISVLNDIVHMASAVAGNRERLQAHPGFLLLINPTSPLVHSPETLEKLMVMAENRLPVIYTPGILAGATSPVTIAGAVVQANAEILTGLVIHQLVYPGAPFVYGGGMSPMDMHSGQPTYSAPEAMMAQAGLCQIGRELYHLPTWGFGGCSAAKACDEQAVNEAATYNLMAAWMGTNLVHDVGYIEFGITYSLELLVLCNEFIGQIRRMMEGIVVDDAHMALEAIDRVGPGGTFLMDPHTLLNFKSNWQPDLTDRKTRRKWEEHGRQSMKAKADERIRSILATHTPEPLDGGVVKKIRDILKRGV